MAQNQVSKLRKFRHFFADFVQKCRESVDEINLTCKTWTQPFLLIYRLLIPQ